MKRYILIVRNKGYRPVDRAKLIDGARASGKAVVDVRIGTEHVEFDVLSDSPPVVEGFELLELVDLSTRNVQDSSKALEEAVRLFDAERFWESHETLEPVWRISSNIDRKLFHGLILTAAAFVHLQKGDEKGFESILRRAKAEFNVDVKRWMGFDIGRVVKNLDKSLRQRKPFKLSSCRA